MNNYRLISEIGSGAYSTVHKAIDVTNGQIVAIKKISQQHMNIRHVLQRQVNFLHQSFNHPNIIKLYKCFSLASYTYLVFEYMPMDLISYYKSLQQHQRRNLNQDQICYIAYQLCQALKFLHQKGIMHRDIKPQNILINPEDLQIKLIDFGFAKKKGHGVNTNYMITRWYRPLQIVLSLPYDQKVDVFATGALLLQLYLGQQIFRSSSNIDQFYWITDICGYTPWDKSQEAIKKLGLQLQQKQPYLGELTKSIRPLGSDIISKMLKCSPLQRCSIQQVLRHPYFSRFMVKHRINTITNQPINKNKKQDFHITRFDSQGMISHRSRNVRAFSTEEGANNLFSFTYKNQNQKDLSINKYKNINQKKQSEQKQLKVQYQMKMPATINRIQKTSQQKKLQSNQSLQKNNQLPQNLRNRTRSLNQGINVISLKKIKFNRQQQLSKSKQNQIKLETGHAIRLNQRVSKPMCLRVKQKINQGKLKDRGQVIFTKTTSRSQNEEIGLHNKISGSSKKIGYAHDYKQYRLDY